MEERLIDCFLQASGEISTLCREYQSPNLVFYGDAQAMKQTVNSNLARRIDNRELLEAKTILDEKIVITLLVRQPQSTKTQSSGSIPRLYPAQRSQPHQSKEVCSETWPVSIEIAIQLLLPGLSSETQ